MQYPGLNFSELQDIPPLRHYYDVPRVSVTGKGLFAMNGAMRRQVGERREFRAKATADGCYLVLFPGETPNIRFSAKGGSVIHTDLARTLAEKRNFAACRLYDGMVSGATGVGRPLPRASNSGRTSGATEESGRKRGREGKKMRRKRDISLRGQRLIDRYIDEICRALHLLNSGDLHQCAWEAILSVYRDNPEAFSLPFSSGWRQAYLVVWDALEREQKQINFWMYRQTSLDQPISNEIPISRTQLLQSPHTDFQNSVCLHDYLNRMERDTSRLAYGFIYGETMDEIRAYYKWSREHTYDTYNNLRAKMEEYQRI